MKTPFTFLLSFSFFIASAQSIVVDKQQTGSTVTLYATNNEYCPVSVQLDLTMENASRTAGAQSIIVVPGRTQKFKLTELNVVNVKKKWEYSYKYNLKYGNVNLTGYDTDHVYDLPFKKGNTFLVFQGYKGTFSHKNENALDFRMPVGTDVLAARGGTVIKVVQLNSLSCTEEDCKKYNNYITIYHSDGTLANYVHIQMNGAKVKEGDVVKAGDVIALSGNVGYSSGPHLHFVCLVPRFGKEQSIITKFRTGDGTVIRYLQENDSCNRSY